MMNSVRQNTSIPTFESFVKVWITLIEQVSRWQGLYQILSYPSGIHSLHYSVLVHFGGAKSWSHNLSPRHQRGTKRGGQLGKSKNWSGRHDLS